LIRFQLATPKSEVNTIRIELYPLEVKCHFKFDIGRSIKPEHWYKNIRRTKSMKGVQVDCNLNLNLIFNEYEFA